MGWRPEKCRQGSLSRSAFSCGVGCRKSQITLRHLTKVVTEIDCGIGKAELYGTVLEDEMRNVGTWPDCSWLKGKEEI